MVGGGRGGGIPWGGGGGGVGTRGTDPYIYMYDIGNQILQEMIGDIPCEFLMFLSMQLDAALVVIYGQYLFFTYGVKGVPAKCDLPIWIADSALCSL